VRGGDEGGGGDQLSHVVEVGGWVRHRNCACNILGILGLARNGNTKKGSSF